VFAEKLSALPVPPQSEVCNKSYNNYNIIDNSLTIRYIRKKSLTWTQKLGDRINLFHSPHVAGKKYEKEETETTNASAHLVPYRFNIREGT